MPNPFIMRFDEVYRETNDPKAALNVSLSDYINSRHLWLTRKPYGSVDAELPGKLNGLRETKAWTFNVQETIDKMLYAYELIQKSIIEDKPGELHHGQLKELLTHAHTINNDHLSAEERTVTRDKHNKLAFVYSIKSPHKILPEGLKPADCKVSTGIFSSN